MQEIIGTYNAYVSLINRGLASKNDVEFLRLSDTIKNLVNEGQKLSDKITSNQTILTQWQQQVDQKTDGKFSIKGAFSNITLADDLDGIKGENDQAGQLESDLKSNTKTTLSHVDNNNILKTQNDADVGKAVVLSDKIKTCIVSDNFKTMNSCVAR